MDQPTVMTAAHCRCSRLPLRAIVNWWICLLICLGLAESGAAAGQTFTNADCLECHLDPTTTWIVNGKTVSVIFPTNAFQM